MVSFTVVDVVFLQLVVSDRELDLLVTIDPLTQLLQLLLRHEVEGMPPFPVFYITLILYFRFGHFLYFEVSLSSNSSGSNDRHSLEVDLSDHTSNVVWGLRLLQERWRKFSI